MQGDEKDAVRARAVGPGWGAEQSPGPQGQGQVSFFLSRWIMLAQTEP